MSETRHGREPVCKRWLECCCDDAGDGHCWQCGWSKDDHAQPAPAEPHREVTPDARERAPQSKEPG